MVDAQGCVAVIVFGMTTQLQAEVKVSDFGKTADGTPVERVHAHQFRQARSSS